MSGLVDEAKTRRNYAFLERYRDSEIAELKAAIRTTATTTTRDADAVADLKRALVRMESRKQAQTAKDDQQAVLRAHRAAEKELIKQGKKPFYLKKAEQKKRALVARFEGMNEKQVERLIERRRKKRAGRERRGMPDGRRV